MRELDYPGRIFFCCFCESDFK